MPSDAPPPPLLYLAGSQRALEIETSWAKNGRVSIVLPINVAPRPHELVLVCASDEGDLIDGLWLAESGAAVATGLRRALVLQREALHIRVASTSGEGPPSEIRGLIRGASRSGAFVRLDVELWQALWTWISDQMGDVRQRILSLLDVARSRAWLAGRSGLIRRMEWDAIVCALTTLGTRGVAVEEMARDWHTDPEVVASAFLRGAPNHRYREIEILNHESGVLSLGSAWDEVLRGRRSSNLASAEFRSGNRRITILNVNQCKLEETLGCDLIYYNSGYDAVTLVQYKCLEGTGGEALEEEYFRASPSSNVWRQFAALMQVQGRSALQQSVGGLDEYRMESEACFLRLCSRMQDVGRTSDLLDGYYLPVRLALLAAGRDGRRETTDEDELRRAVRVTGQSIGRGMSNSLFTVLLRDGWIGKSIGQIGVDELQSLVRGRLDAGRQLTIALADGVGSARR